MDKTLLIWFNQELSNPWLDLFFSWISQKWEFSAPLLVIICILFVQRFGTIGILIWISLTLSILLGDGIGNFLKITIGQFRPCFEMSEMVRHIERPFNIRCSSQAHGMPSNHALNFFLALGFIAMLTKSWRWIIPFTLIAVCVSLSRIYLGVHYPSQVLGGAFIGIFLGILFETISRKLIVKYAPSQYSLKLYPS